MTDSLEHIRVDLLIEGLEDYVGMWEVARAVREQFGNETAETVRLGAVSVILPLFERRAVEAGTLTKDGGFAPWREQGRSAVMRIAKEWQDLGRDPDISELCWLRNTPHGDTLARQSAH